MLKETRQFLWVGLLTALMFAIDFLMPLGLASAIPYILVVWFSLSLPRRRHTIIVAVVCSILAICGVVFDFYFALSPRRIDPWMILVNRTLAISAIWVTAVLGMQLKSSERRLRSLSESLERQVHDRTAQLEQANFSLQKEVIDRQQATTERDRLFELSLDMLCIAGVDGYFKSINPAFERILGYRTEELLSKPFVEFVHPDDREATLAEIQKLAIGKDTVRFENRYRCKDGSYCWLSWSTRGIRGGAQLVYAVARDITEQKEAEAALQKAKKAAEAANQAKSEFLASMSHEIRTPMNAVIGLTELVLDTELKPMQRDYLNTVLESAESLLAIINEILDFSKIEAGKIELEQTPFDLAEELGDTMKALGLRAHEKGLELTYHIDDDVPHHLIGDSVRLRQILVNLVGNAIKFTHQGEVVLRVQTQRAAHEGAAHEVSGSNIQLHFAVTDTGIGIAQEKLGRIFQAFEQADNSITRQFGGTGLGLAISARLVDLMGGKLSVESTPGMGSTFHFTANFGIGPQPETDLYTLAAEQLPEMSVLIVDDNDTNRAILQHTLAGWGLDIKAAASGPEALELLHQRQAAGRPIRLVLSDVHMPEMDGFTLAEQIKQQPELEDPVIILLTSGGRMGDLTRGQELGIAAQLIKPIKASELLDAILEAVGKQSVAATDRSEPIPQLTGSFGSLRILLAEDGIANQKLAIGLLQKWGHRVTVADNGREAVEKWQAETFDLILMDVQMPEMDGLQAARTIRQFEQHSGGHIPIVAMTARAMTEDREQCLAAGMDGYISKPFRQRELYQALAHFFDETETAVSPSTLQSDAAADASDWVKAGLAALDGNQALLRDVVEAVLEECPALLEHLQHAIDRHDAATVKRTAHTLKGSLWIFDFTTIIDLAWQLEQQAGDDNLQGAEDILAQLSAEYKQIEPQLRAYLWTSEMAT